jgi:hypothetical protein
VSVDQNESKRPKIDNNSIINQSVITFGVFSIPMHFRHFLQFHMLGNIPFCTSSSYNIFLQIFILISES